MKKTMLQRLRICCSSCGLQNLAIQEFWQSSIAWVSDGGWINSDDGEKDSGNPSHFVAICLDCEHSWRPRTNTIRRSGRPGLCPSVLAIATALHVFLSPEQLENLYYNLYSQHELERDGIKNNHGWRIFETGWSEGAPIFANNPIFAFKEPKTIIKTWLEA